MQGPHQMWTPNGSFCRAKRPDYEGFYKIIFACEFYFTTAGPVEETGATPPCAWSDQSCPVLLEHSLPMGNPRLQGSFTVKTIPSIVTGLEAFNLLRSTFFSSANSLVDPVNRPGYKKSQVPGQTIRGLTNLPKNDFFM